jgi:tetratricopeptide (TPR) repeat protein
MKILKYPAAALLLAALAIPLSAQTSAQTEAQRKAQVQELMRKAEAAFKDENRELAEKLFLQVLELDPEQSKPYYKLGVLAVTAGEALSWFKQYVELEPDDAWGWLAVGRKSLKVGKTREGLAALLRASKLEPKAKDIQEALDEGRSLAAPTLEPLVGYASDSDGFDTWRYGLEAAAALPGGFRLGGRFSRSDLRGLLQQATIDEFLVRLEGRPLEALRLSLTAGLALTPAQVTGINDITVPATTPEADFRVRWRPPDGGPAFDLRIRRALSASNPTLIINQAVQDDGRIGIELPLGPLRVRGTGRASLIETASEPLNLRLQTDAALALRLSWRGEVSVQYHTLGFERPTSAGYLIFDSRRHIMGRFPS